MDEPTLPMSFALLFAVLMILWFIWGIVPNAPQQARVSHVLLFVLFLLLGWKCFGPLLHP